MMQNIFLMRKRRFTQAVLFLLALLLVVGTFSPITVEAATYTVTTMNQLTEAIANAANGDVITIGNDLVAEDLDAISSATTSNKSITIEGNGHTIDFNGKTAHPLIKSKEGGTITLRNATFKNLNSNFRYSNGIVAVYKSKIVVENCTFINNRSVSGDGGGALSVHNSSGAIEVKNSTFYQNSSSKDGGAIYSAGKGSLINCTFVDNTAADKGGALRNSSTSASSQTVLYHSIAVNNTAINGQNVYRMATDGGYNILGSSEETGTNGTSIYDAADAAEWMELDLGVNGGTTPTFALKNVGNSPAIDRIPDTANNLLSVDQRGVDRPQGLAYDIGAYEYKNGISITNFAASVDEAARESGQAITLNYTINGDTEGFDTKVNIHISATGRQESKYFSYKKLSETSDLSQDRLTFTGEVVYQLNAPSDYIVEITVTPAADKSKAETMEVDLRGNPNKSAEAMIDSLPEVDDLQFEDADQVLAARIYIDYLLTLNGGLTETIANYEKLTALEEKLLELQPNVSTMSQLAAEIDRTEAGGIVRLTGNIIADESSMITITKNITIDGDGYSIDGNGKTAVFYMNKSGQVLTLKNLAIKNASGANGSAVYVRSGSVLLEDTKLTNNTATGSGGALYVYEKAGLTLRNTEVVGNSGRTGGAIYTGEKSTLLIENSSINENTSTDNGGAVSVGKEASFTMKNTAVSGNHSDKKGGAVFINKEAKVTVENSALFENRAVGAGGAIGGIDKKTGLALIHCSIVANQSGELGGGIAQDKNESTTFAIYNSIVAGNKSGDMNNDIDNKTSGIDKGYNLIGTVTGTAPAIPATSQREASFGETYTNWMDADQGYRLKEMADHPAVDQIPTTAVNYRSTDILGVARGNQSANTGALADIGAYELVQSPTATLDAISSASLKITDMNEQESDAFESDEPFLAKSLLYYLGTDHEDDNDALDDPYFAMNFTVTDLAGQRIDVVETYRENTENPAHFGTHGDEYAKFVEYVFSITVPRTQELYLTMNAVSAPEIKVTKKLTITNLSPEPELELDKEVLQRLVDQAGGLAEADYTAGSWQALQHALTAARDTLAAEEATQQQIDEASGLLQAAIEALTLMHPEVEKPSVSSGGGSRKRNTNDQVTEPVKEPAIKTDTPKTSDSGFDDTQNHWAKASIETMTGRGLFNGVDSNHFAPEATTTRAMVVTVLSRVDNVPLSSDTISRFADVPAGQWYSGAIEWAANQNIVGGVGADQFNPDGSVTREQIAVMLYNYLRYKGYELPEGTETATFADEAKSSTWAKDAISAMQQAGIISGKPGNAFDPQGVATRAEVCTILARFIDTFEK